MVVPISHTRPVALNLSHKKTEPLTSACEAMRA